MKEISAEERLEESLEGRTSAASSVAPLVIVADTPDSQPPAAPPPDTPTGAPDSQPPDVPESTDQSQAPAVTTQNGQNSTPAVTTQNGHSLAPAGVTQPEHSPASPTTTSTGHRSARSAAQTRSATASRSPGRKRQASRPAAYSRVQKIIIGLALVGIVLGSTILGASLMMKLTAPQQALIAATQPIIVHAVGATPRILNSEQRAALYIDQMIRHMSLDEELGQMIMVEWDDGGTFDSDLQYMLTNQHAGGIILYTFNENIQTSPQVTALTSAIQAHAKIPLLISIDQEGGEVNRLDPITGPRPSAREIGATNDPNVAYQQGVSDGQILKQLGINDNLAPDVDVQSLSDAAFDASSMAGFEYRMYGTTPEKVATFAGAYLNGLQSQDIIGTLKHWPGLGADTVDPHDALPTLQSSQAELNSINFAPYRTLLAQEDVDMIMSTHELVPAYDPNLPATLSPILINQVLRQELGYQGVVITDGLYMKAISDHWTLAQAAVLAVQAGNDILLGPYNIQGVQNVLNALHAAVTSGQISKARIDLSVERILSLKIKYGLITVPANFTPSSN